MQKDQNLFKAATFLTALIKSDNKDIYLHEGFNKRDMIEELEILSSNTSYGSVYDDYKDKIESSIDEVLTCLSKEGLIYYKDNSYFITPDGENISHFMTSLSKMYFQETQAMVNFPYRFYPNSEQIYGLN